MPDGVSNKLVGRQLVASCQAYIAHEWRWRTDGAHEIVFEMFDQPLLVGDIGVKLFAFCP
jgi:hypothetical protein